MPRNIFKTRTNIMKHLARIIYLGLMIAFSAGLLQAADIKDGFMGTKWQTDLSTLENFLKVKEKDDLAETKAMKGSLASSHKRWIISKNTALSGALIVKHLSKNR